MSYFKGPLTMALFLLIGFGVFGPRLVTLSLPVTPRRRENWWWAARRRRSALGLTNPKASLAPGPDLLGHALLL
jgi:hypothetical protein